MTKSIMEKIEADITVGQLLADKLIEDIFTRSEILATTQEVYATANVRIAIGNPPGKNNMLSAFVKGHFEGVAFSFDNTRDALIEDLSASQSFAMTHELVGKLEAYSYFSLKEVERIPTVAVENTHFGRIVTDPGVSDFLNRVAVLRLSSIAVQEQREILHSILKKQQAQTEANSDKAFSPIANFRRSCVEEL